MKVYNEVCDAWDVKELAWSGAKETVERLTDDEIETVLSMLEDCYPDGMSETELNDFFWFEEDTICDWLDITEDELYEREE